MPRLDTQFSTRVCCVRALTRGVEPIVSCSYQELEKLQTHKAEHTELDIALCPTRGLVPACSSTQFYIASLDLCVKVAHTTGMEASTSHLELATWYGDGQQVTDIDYSNLEGVPDAAGSCVADLIVDASNAEAPGPTEVGAQLMPPVIDFEAWQASQRAQAYSSSSLPQMFNEYLLQTALTPVQVASPSQSQAALCSSQAQYAAGMGKSRKPHE